MDPQTEKPAPDQGVHDPEMTEQDEANAPDTEPTDDRELARHIDEQGPRAAEDA